ncbi:MAG TPA: DUF488 family protein [Chloroflexota bacterium]|nr:DUF488 family protein [Chloroflexota bacterium]
MTFRGDSIYSRDASEDPGLRVLIMRIWPRGVRKDRVDVWMKDASPSRELLDAYHHTGLGWRDFEARYRREIVEERPQVLHELRRLEREHGTVTLLCFERIPPEQHCHRLTLMGMLADGSG